MENMLFCQSCGMPLNGTEDFGTNSNGGKNADFCRYCYENGAFTMNGTMEEMIEICVPYSKEHYGSEDAARKALQTFFPTLKRWMKNT